LHIVNIAATGAPAFFGKNPFDPVAFKDCLNCASSQSANLSALTRNKQILVKRRFQLLSLMRQDQN